MMNPGATSTHLFIAAIAAMCSYSAVAQNTDGLTRFPELIMTNIDGAPSLGMPMLVKNGDAPAIGQGHGLAAPAFWDWDDDGLKDLLIGEFGSGVDLGHYMGNFIRVYLNTGTETQPAFDERFSYARPTFYIPSNGTPYSVDQFCCMGFTPQFFDLDGDGLNDMVSGQYYGEVIWFKGSHRGFLDGKPLPQPGNPREPNKKAFKVNQTYWLYSSASFGDVVPDGKIDMVVGGLGGLRVSKNIGESALQFGPRELLLDVQGNPLRVFRYESNKPASDERYVGGDPKLSPLVVDWDQDGVLDLLVTNSYNHKGLSVVDFFKGRKIKNELRFEQPAPLFTAKEKVKAFPGSSPHIFVTDWNNDGVNDLLLGVSVLTVRDQFNEQLSWSWEEELSLGGAGKDPANALKSSESQLNYYKQTVKLPPGMSMDDYLSIRHQGVVFVMLGSQDNNSSTKDNNNNDK